jgi:ferredoxin-type protein NapH
VKRKLIQALSTLLHNGYLAGFIRGRIYQGPLKHICVPGFNCYSCPGALGACPIGSLQTVAAGVRYQFSLYVFGLLMLFGAVAGRWICGWLCPFGLIQELLHKIPTKKIKVSPKLKPLNYLKYALLIIFVLLLPAVWVNSLGLGSPTFCRYICPAGTLTGAVPLLISIPSLQDMIGSLFLLKASIAAAVVAGSVLIYRPFCRWMCPLGAIYALFNKVSLYRMHVHYDACTHCGRCEDVCPMGIDPMRDPNAPECIRCGICRESCPTGAITQTFGLQGTNRKATP